MGKQQVYSPKPRRLLCFQKLLLRLSHLLIKVRLECIFWGYPEIIILYNDSKPIFIEQENGSDNGSPPVPDHFIEGSSRSNFMMAQTSNLNQGLQGTDINHHTPPPPGAIPAGGGGGGIVPPMSGERVAPSWPSNVYPHGPKQLHPAGFTPHVRADAHPPYGPQGYFPPARAGLMDEGLPRTGARDGAGKFSEDWVGFSNGPPWGKAAGPDPVSGSGFVPVAKGKMPQAREAQMQGLSRFSIQIILYFNILCVIFFRHWLSLPSAGLTPARRIWRTPISAG